VPVKTDILPSRYRGAKRIGRGGMGEIYRATDDVLGRAVAIKILADRYAEDDSVRQRFTREALAAARLSGDPNIVTIYDVGEWNERPYIVMEYLSGGSLDDTIGNEDAQPPERALRWLEQAARALDRAHAGGVVHRDVKPGNLLLDREGEVHVADFGIASAAGLDSLTMTGTVLGTAGYLSPEQAQGQRATAASDNYALAVVAFELLTGTRPFERESATAEAAAHVHESVPSACERERDLPCEVDEVLVRALAKDPAKRYASAADFVADLRDAFARAAGETVVAAPAPSFHEPDWVVPPYVMPRRGRRRWPLVLALVALGALAGGILAFALTRDGGSRMVERTRTLVTTQQGEVRTVRVTTQAQSPAPPPPPPPPPAVVSPPPPPASPPPPSAVGGANPSTMVDQATGLIRQGRYDEALPIAQQALRKLQGSGQIYEAYAEYDVGRSLAELGRCDEALPHVDRSEAIQGHRKEFDSIRKKCKKEK
jgi:eukaryotic-like serine/threonine-protein kinase